MQTMGMNTLWLIDNLGSGGAQREPGTLAITFKRAGHDMSILTDHHENFLLHEIGWVELGYINVYRESMGARLLAIQNLQRTNNQGGVLLLSFNIFTRVFFSIKGVFPFCQRKAQMTMVLLTFRKDKVRR
jgi:hypothetical protein